MGVAALDISFGVAACESSLGVAAFETSFGVGSLDVSLGVATVVSSLDIAMLVLIEPASGDVTGLCCLDAAPPNRTECFPKLGGTAPPRVRRAA